jgi:O-antigen/teichoic acid export membrane protein
VTFGIATTLLSRGIGVAVPLILFPVTLRYLGADLFGLWMAVAALTGIAASGDLGFGNGLMTKLAPCYSANDPERTRRYVSSTYVALITISLSACVLLLLSSRLIPWSSIFNVSGSATASDARNMALVCLTAFVVNIPLSLVSRVLYAYQLVGISNIWQAAGTVLSITLALGAVYAEQSPFVVVAATYLGPILVNATNTVWTYGFQISSVAPRLRFFDQSLAREVLRLSGLFVALTIVISLADSMDSIIIAHVTGLENVAAYAVPARIFAMFGVFLGLINMLLWPFHGEALAKGDIAWVRRTAWRMSFISMLAALVPSIAIVIFGEVVFGAWLGLPSGQSRWLLAGLALWWVMLATISPRFMVQNAAGIVRPQLIGYGLYLTFSTVAKWYGVKHLGITSIPYIGVAVFTLTALPAALYGYRIACRKPEKETHVIGHETSRREPTFRRGKRDIECKGES